MIVALEIRAWNAPGCPINSPSFKCVSFRANVLHACMYHLSHDKEFTRTHTLHVTKG